MRISVVFSKRTCFSLVVVILGLMTQDFAMAQTTEIKVAFFYTTRVKNSYPSGVEPGLVNLIRDRLNTAYALSGFPNIIFTVAGHRELTHSGANLLNETGLSLNNASLLSHSLNESDRLRTSAGESIEDVRAALQADVVYVIYDESISFQGGSASASGGLPVGNFPWPQIHRITISDEIARGFRYVAAHEMGHVMGCRHPNTGPDSDNSIQPFANCHGYVFPDGKLATIMTPPDACIAPACSIIPNFSDKDTDHIVGGVNHGKRGDANADAVASLQTAAVTVSGYGDNLSPPSEGPTVAAGCPPPTWVNCSGPGIATWFATWNAPAGTAVLEYILEADHANSGNFWVSYVGPSDGFNCPAPASLDTLIYRVAYRTITGTSPYCPRIFVHHNCPDPGGGGGGGPIP